MDKALPSSESKAVVAGWGRGFNVNPEGYTKMMVTKKVIELLKTRGEERVCGYTPTTFKSKDGENLEEASFTVWRFNLLPIKIAEACALRGKCNIGADQKLSAKDFPDPAFLLALPTERDDADGDDCPSPR